MSLSKKWHATVLQLRTVRRPTFWWRKWWCWTTFHIIFAQITSIRHRTSMCGNGRQQVSPHVDGWWRTLTCADVCNVNAARSWRLVRWRHEVRV